MTAKKYYSIKNKLVALGYEDEINMISSMLSDPCDDSETFFKEYVWVVINSGLRNQIAEIVYYRILIAIKKGYDISGVFKHSGKVLAIKEVLSRREQIFVDYKNAKDKLEFLKTLPYIGDATKYHLARNLGINVCKPDRHLIRIAESYKTTPDDLCQKLSKETYDSVGIIDVVLWRAGNLKYI